MTVHIAVTRQRSEPAVTVVCSSAVLCLYCHWLCSVDNAIWFVGLMFKRKHNESPYGKSVTVTETVFTQRTIAGELLVKNCHSELHKYPTVSLGVDVKSRTDRQTYGLTAGCVLHVTCYFYMNLTKMRLLNCEQ